MHKYNIDKLLDECQKGARTRTLTVEDIDRVLSVAEQMVLTLPIEARTRCKLIYCPFTVAKSYKYSAYGTCVTCTFSIDGSPINLLIERTYVSQQSRCRILVDVANLSEQIIEELNKCGLNVYGFIRIQV